ncbi:vitamin D3 receptor-like [Oppia nitens]|uniref:vitamin D3 receptor-like n=1 Tax=Oppia nitens TaxID=1686743 RepID=UPI0023D9CC12|nr:vitamin D3 receptor-like [Oppia nitens]
MTDYNSLICQICGDKSNGYHFGAISCDSCKSFFKRNFSKYKDKYKCYLGGKCVVEIKTRTNCKKCRLDKCLAAGMSTIHFNSDEQNKLRRTLLKSRQKSKRLPQDLTNDKTLDFNESKLIFTPNISQQLSKDCLQVINVSNDVIDYDFIDSMTDFSTNSLSLSSTDDITQNHTIDEQMDSIDISDQNNNEGIIMSIMRPITECVQQFTELESNKLTELLDAMKLNQRQISTIEKGCIIDNLQQALLIVLERHNDNINHTVQMSKYLSAFNTLCLSDQIVLLKYSSIEIEVLRNILCFNFEKEYWIFNKGDIPYCITLNAFQRTDSNPEIPVNVRPINDHKVFLQNMGLDWDCDPLIIDLVVDSNYTV